MTACFIVRAQIAGYFVAMLDIDGDTLTVPSGNLQEANAHLAIVCDVSDWKAVESAVHQVIDTRGACQL